MVAGPVIITGAPIPCQLTISSPPFRNTFTRLSNTIDYGPYGWLDNYDELWTPNTTDASGRRYCYGRQPAIAYWNLQRLAEAIAPLFKDTDGLEEILNSFYDGFQKDWVLMLCNKLGFKDYPGKKADELIDNLLKLFKLTETDMTIFYRQLAKLDLYRIKDKGVEEIPEVLKSAYYDLNSMPSDVQYEICEWLKDYCCLLLESTKPDVAEIQHYMNTVNPKYVLRNYLSQEVIEAAENNNFEPLYELEEVMKKPYDEQPDKEKFAEKRPDWARNKAGCSMLSCSS